MVSVDIQTAGSESANGQYLRGHVEDPALSDGGVGVRSQHLEQDADQRGRARREEGHRLGHGVLERGAQHPRAVRGLLRGRLQAGRLEHGPGNDVRGGQREARGPLLLLRGAAVEVLLGGRSGALGNRGAAQRANQARSTLANQRNLMRDGDSKE